MLINKEHLLDQLNDRPPDGWISVQAARAMIEAEPEGDLKAEAKKRGYGLHKHQPYVPINRCTCGKRPVHFESLMGSHRYRCVCGKEIKWYRSDKEARREWNRMVGE